MAEIVVGISDVKCTNNRQDVLVTYALGSCVAVAVYDPVAMVGGLLHYMLPDSTLNKAKAMECPAMFADTGIPLLYKTCYSLGAEKRRMIVKIIGGANILNDGDYFRIGQKNITAARRILWKNNVIITSEDTGLHHNRTVWLRVNDGICLVRSLGGVMKEI